MKFLRNIYFWMLLGTIAVVIGGDFVSMNDYYYLPSKEDRAIDAQIKQDREAEGKSTDLPDPYLAGFGTAVVLGVFWYLVSSKDHPPKE